MGEKKKFVLSTRLENVVKGIAAVLFSISLGLNVGKVMRTIAFPLIYFFGSYYYVLLALFLVLSFYRIFSGEKAKFKFATTAGIIFLMVGLFFLFGYITISINQYSYTSNNINDAIDLYNAQLANYYDPGFLNTFSGLWTNGFIGMALGSFIANDAIVLVIGLIVSLFGIGLLLVYPVMAFITYIQTSKEVRQEKRRALRIAKAKEKEKDDIEEEPAPEILPIQEEPEQEQEFEVQFGFEPDQEIEKEGTDFRQNSFLSLDEDYISRKPDSTGFSEFTPLSFSNNEPVITRPTYTEPVKEEVPPLSNPVVEEEQVLDNEESDFEGIEQVDIIEDNDEITPDYISYEPKVVEPVKETPKPVVNNPIPTPTSTPVSNPVPEAPKKRPRVVWVAPSSDLLEEVETAEAQETNARVAESRMATINQIFADYRIGARCLSYTMGSSVTRFNIEYDANASSKQLEKYINDISRRLNGVTARFTPIVANESFSGLEVPNATITTVSFKEVYECLPNVNKHPLSVGFGKDISGNVIAADFDEFPHLLVAGTTGSGKSIYIHSIIATLIMRVSPDDLKIVLVDPKKVEMTKYRDMPHLLCPIITEASKAKVMLSKLVDEMNNRYEQFAVADSCSNIKQYNEYAKDHNIDRMPYIIVVLDEYADLVDTCKEISQPVVSIAQKARAAGIHMLISTQRPSTNVITGVIKGNLPTHVALMTSSYTDSMTILGEGGAEKLLGKGDMLVQSPLVSRVGLTRLQGCYIQNREIARIVGYLKEHYETHYDENYMDLVDHSKEVATQKVESGEVLKEADEAEEAKYQSIKEWVMSQQFVSMSKIQRECGVGFNRAGRFFNRLQKEGIVSTTQDGSTKGCKVLVHDDLDFDDSIVTSDELIS